MFSNKLGRFAAASLFVFCAVGLAHADEKQLTLDDIDTLARQNLVNSMRKSDGVQPSAGGVALSAPIMGAPPAAASPTVVAKPKRADAPAKRVVPVSFVGAYSDASGAHVLYEYQGGVYTASRGEKLLNGWTVTHVDGYRVTVAEGKRNWSDVISVPGGAASVGDNPAIQAITDLGGPLPVATNVGIFPGAH
ncbi:hypothetical protein LJ656_32270 [Paraburkholderia sp. MMS20-SJTR3]|uniref:Secreted protein n=1 Tax=Paraburkholderia sejongensis TaxID=2886946 RepID=A0ABS8K534_9BURK|nr:hypothetical protein [Paraburkholderia sp. MMS20-SJTR3]MCC8397251.1 hypothetical protein [Paraburkholderia sp. MMS20-SJTR3]